MQPLKRVRSRTVVIPSRNIDTDQIIPARFLTTTTKEGLGKHLFADWRYLADGTPNPRLHPESATAARGCRCWWRAATSAAAPRASMRPGRWSTTEFAPSSAPRSPTSSAAIP